MSGASEVYAAIMSYATVPPTSVTVAFPSGSAFSGSFTPPTPSRLFTDGAGGELTVPLDQVAAVQFTPGSGTLSLIL